MQSQCQRPTGCVGHGQVPTRRSAPAASIVPLTGRLPRRCATCARAALMRWDICHKPAIASSSASADWCIVQPPQATTPGALMPQPLLATRWIRSSQSQTAAGSGSLPLIISTPYLPCCPVRFQPPLRWRYRSRICPSPRLQDSSQASEKSCGDSAPRSDVVPICPRLRTLGWALMPHSPSAAQLIATTNTTNQIQTLTLAPTPPTRAKIRATRIRTPTQSPPLRPHGTQIYLTPRSPPHPHRLTRLGGSGSPCDSRPPRILAQSGAGSGVDLPV